MMINLSLLLSLSLLAGAEVLPQPLPGDSLQTTIHKLSNGMTVYLSPNAQVPRLSAWVAVRTGSKNDPAATTGLAHYLEHMLFKGTQSLGTLDYEKEKPHLDKIVELYEKHYREKDAKARAAIYKEIDAENLQAVKYSIPNELDKVYRQLGMQELNAFTTDDATVYMVDMPANRLEAWAALEKERFSKPVFRLFQSELEAVYEEKNRGLDNADRIIAEALQKKLYKKHPYGTQTTLGEIEHLKNPSLKNMYDYYRKWYVPGNMAIALAGDLDPQKTLALLEKTLGTLPVKPVPPAMSWPLPPPSGVERVEVSHEAEEKVVIAWPTVAHNHPDADALAVMDMLMDNATSGLINLELNQAQKVKSAGSYETLYSDAGDWQVWAVTKASQTLEQAEKLLLETTEHLKEGRFTAEDIKAVITSYEVSEKARLESNDARVNVMADAFIHAEPWSEAAGRLDRLRRVTKEDVLRVAHKYLRENRVVAYRRNGKAQPPSITKPSFTKVDLDQTRASSFARKLLAMPAPEIEPRWLVEGRDYQIAGLPAGKLYAVKNPFNDLFSLTFVFERGSHDDRKLCAALSLLELAGAGDMTAEQYKKKLFSLGTAVGYGCSEHRASIGISGLDQNLWESLDLMRRRFEAPRVDTETLKNMVDVMIGAHRDAKRDPGAVYGALSQWARRGKDSPILAELSDDELRRLDLPALIASIKALPGFAHRTSYVGNRPLGELAKLLEEARTYRATSLPPPLRFLRPEAPRVLFTHRDMVQARVGFYVADEPFKPGDIVDYNFLGSYLGGDMSAVLFQEIREARSLAYSAGGGYQFAGRKGDDSQLWGSLGCQADKTVEAAALLRQLELSPPWSPERFTETKAALEQNYRANPIQFREAPEVLLTWDDMELPPGDPRPARFAKLKSYSLENLKTFAARFNSRPSTLYILGDRTRVGMDGLKKLGTLEERPLDSLFPY